MPTVLDLVGIQARPSVDGHSALAAIRGEKAAAAPAIYFEALDAYLTRNWAPLTGVIADGWKYIDLPDPELYDLAHDPGELHNRVNDAAQRVAVLRQRLSGWPPASAALLGAPTAPIDADAAARLRALGYTGGQTPHAGRLRYTSDDDPKHLLDLDRRYERALTLTGERRYDEAAALLEGVVAERRDFAVAYLNLASVFIASGHPAKAIAVIEGAAKQGVTSPELRGRLGAAYLAAGEPARAVTVLEPLAGPKPAGGVDALNTLAVALTKVGGIDRARVLFSRVLEQSPRSATTWNNLGLLELSSRRPAEAARAFEQAVAADAGLAQAWQGLGAARVQSDPSAAIAAWTRALALEPRDYDLLFNLGVLLRDQGRAAEARPYIERFVREAPRDRYGQDIVTLRSWLQATSK